MIPAGHATSWSNLDSTSVPPSLDRKMDKDQYKGPVSASRGEKMEKQGVTWEKSRRNLAYAAEH